MRRLVFIVEGKSEVQFVNQLLIPYLSSKDGVMSNFEPSFFGKGKSTDFRKVKSTP